MAGDDLDRPGAMLTGLDVHPQGAKQGRLRPQPAFGRRSYEPLAPAFDVEDALQAFCLAHADVTLGGCLVHLLAVGPDSPVGSGQRGGTPLTVSTGMAIPLAAARAPR